MLCAIKNCIISLHLQLAQIFPLPLIEAEMCNFPYLNCDEDKKKKKTSNSKPINPSEKYSKCQTLL